MRGLILGLSVAALALPATAQVQRCGAEFGKWVCRTEQPPARPDIMQTGADAFARTQADGAFARQQYENARGAAVEQARQSDAERSVAAELELRQRVGNLVSAHNCAAAKELALKAGDLDLAEQAVRLCAN